MELWQQIGLGVIAAAALIFFLPAALRSRKEDRKATADDWKAVALPIGLVVAFVILLILMVS